jgi:hypothetical protein
MPGTLTGCANMLFLNQSATQRAQVVFKNIYDVMTSHTSAQIISLFYGNTGTVGNGNGTDYYDGTNSFRGGAFFVVKMPSNSSRDFDYYWLCQFKGDAALSGSALPHQFESTTPGAATPSVAISMCAVSGSSNSPWNGTILNNGADAKSSPVWYVSGASALALPASNADVYATNKQDMVGIVFGAAGAYDRVHFVCNDDSFALLRSQGDSDTYNQILLGGPYIKNSDSSVKSLLLYRGAEVHPNNGATARNTTGIIINYTGSQYVAEPFFGTANRFDTGTIAGTVFQNINNDGYTEMPTEVFSYTSGSGGHQGWFSDDFKIVKTPGAGIISEDGSRAVIGSQGSTTIQWTIPWTPGIPINFGFERNGEFF